VTREDPDQTRVERVDPLMGAVLDNRFRIEFRIAAGGFGAIYRATHVKSGHEVALKVLHTELATSDPRVIARFRREGATLATLRDPHTITAYELGEAPTGELYIVMELLHGESLYEQYRAHGALSWQRVAAIARMVCSSLAEAHGHGIVHRDLKPANIHLEPRDGNPDFVKVLDFGIAKILRESDLDSSELTQAGQMIGTFDYMAPEQMIGGTCTNVTDIYTLGIVMFEMIAGRRPFADAQSPTAILAALLTTNPPLLSESVAVPAALDAIVMRCLEREPQNRFRDVHELAAALDAVLAADGGMTLRNTPAPQLHDEVTVIATPRRGDNSEAGDKRDKTPAPRPRRDSSQPPSVRQNASSPHVVRREGSGPVADPRAAHPVTDPRPHPAIIRREGSQPYPTAAPKPEAWAAPATDPHRELAHPAALPIPRRDPSQPGIGSEPTMMDPGRDGSPPHVLATPPVIGAFPQVTPPGFAPPGFAPPGFAPPGFAPPGFAPNQPYGAQVPLRSSQPVLDLAAWNPPPPPVYVTPARGSATDVQAFDMSGAHSRDAAVRRIVWAIAILIGLVVVLVVASHL
jgi:serine/threonine-protein kinase